MTWVHLTTKSGNRKLGQIPTSTSEQDTCPKECPLAKECYAKGGPLRMHWDQVSAKRRGDNWTPFCKRVARFARRQAWRHNQAGDLPKTKRGLIDQRKLRQLSKAAQHTNGWTYTHFDPTIPHNADAIRETNRRGGLKVNLSADSTQQAQDYFALGIAPVVVTVPIEDPPKATPGGIPIVICPAQTCEEITCETCMLCSKDRNSIVGFLAHGFARKRLSAKLEDN